MFVTLKDSQKKTSYISIYFSKDFFFKSYNNLNIHLISIYKYNDDSGGYNHWYLFQIPIEKKIDKIYISIKKAKSGIEYKAELKKNKADNYFQEKSLKYNINNDFPSLSANSIFTGYLNYFWEKEDDFAEKLKQSLTKALIHKISNEKNMKIRSYNLFKIIKLCIKYDIKMGDIQYIDIIKDKIKLIYYITDEEIDKMISKKQTKIIELIVKILLDIDNKYLMKLIKGKNGKNRCHICRCILDINYEGIKLNNLAENNFDDFNFFQKSLLSAAKSKKEVIYIVNIVGEFKISLEFINKNIDILLQMNSDFFPIDIEPPNNKININEVYNIIKEIIDQTHKQKIENNIINIKVIIKNLLDIAAFKDLNELCVMLKFLPFLENREKAIIGKNLYDKIHVKGMNLIKEKKLTTEEIFKFITSQDVYYFENTYNNSQYRDPEIFKYIPITKGNQGDEEYLNNINIIKNKKLFELFSARSQQIKDEFYNILLNQMKKIIDFKSIFDIFPKQSIDSNFISLINGRIDKLKYTILDEAKENEKIIYDIFDDLFLANYNHSLNLNSICQILEINYDFTSNYFLHVLKTQKLEQVLRQIKRHIINFFLGQNKNNYYNAETMILLLLNSPNDMFSLDILDMMNNLIMKKEDFYQKEENQRYQLFEFFWEKCKHLCHNPKISEGKYLQEISKVKDELIKEISENSINYQLINNIIDDEKFHKKMLSLFKIEGKDPEEYLKKLKENVEICRKRFKQLEDAMEFLNSFFSKSKRKEMEYINIISIEYKYKKISEIIKTKNFFENNKDFDFETELEQ